MYFIEVTGHCVYWINKLVDFGLCCGGIIPNFITQIERPHGCQL
jgi:hypothetical protein